MLLVGALAENDRGMTVDEKGVRQPVGTQAGRWRSTLDQSVAAWGHGGRVDDTTFQTGRPGDTAAGANGQ
ncbi:unnamed protein product [Heligmosomoides polygyrus]|uniref:Attacin_C domain-containing protein n=1 Tax=Heligmosomoides polygyrus TaxID=6339 RepID=A0A183F617_HELPZ|nr:unnamed protein product [Heligmosomoides polygyrus]